MIYPNEITLFREDETNAKGTKGQTTGCPENGKIIFQLQIILENILLKLLFLAGRKTIGQNSFLPSQTSQEREKVEETQSCRG